MNNILNRQQIEEDIKKMLTNYEENCKNINFKKGIYLYGSPGCGKTFFITELLKQLNYDIIKYDAGDVRNKSLIDTITSNNISSQNVLNMMARKPKRIAIIMDEIDGMNNGDKGGITSLIKLIRQKKTKKQKQEHMTMNPIICIGNYYVDKKIKELMKVCNTFELKSPTKMQMFKIVELRIPNILETIDSETVEHIMKYIQGDLRKIEFIEKLYKKNTGLLTIDTLENIFHMKSFNEDSKKITKKLIQQPFSIHEHNRVINETDRTIVALLWHENIVDTLTHIPNKSAVPFYLNILNNICFADFIDRITFQNQIWQFNEMSSLMKTGYNNYLFHKQSYTNQCIHDDIRFTKVLTKYSTEYNNILFVYNLCQELDMDKKDFISFFQELRLFYGKDFLTQNEKMVAVEKIFDNYNISKLDIKRVYRYLDKNVNREHAIYDEDSSDIDE
jgi:DNA polymerase III delta prime subunit